MSAPGKVCLWTVGVDRIGFGRWHEAPGTQTRTVPPQRAEDGTITAPGYEPTFCDEHAEAFDRGEKQAIEPGTTSQGA